MEDQEYICLSEDEEYLLDCTSDVEYEDSKDISIEDSSKAGDNDSIDDKNITFDEFDLTNSPMDKVICEKYGEDSIFRVIKLPVFGEEEKIDAISIQDSESSDIEMEEDSVSLKSDIVEDFMFSVESESESLKNSDEKFSTKVCSTTNFEESESDIQDFDEFESSGEDSSSKACSSKSIKVTKTKNKDLDESESSDEDSSLKACSSESIKVTKTKKSIKSFGKYSRERYRKWKKCPVSQCKAKPQRRLANHMKIYHSSISPSKRRQMCRNALSVSKNYISKPLGQRKLNFTSSKKSSTLTVTPTCSSSSAIEKKTNTRHMGHFSLDCPEVKDFVLYLQTIDGGNKSENTAKLIGKDVSKYLYFIDSSQLDWGHLLDNSKLLRYFEYLKNTCSIGPEGRLTKLERTCDGLNYLKLALRSDKEKLNLIDSLQDQIRRWKNSLRKDKKKLNNQRLEALSESKLDRSAVKKVIQNENMWERFDSIVTKVKNQDSVNDKDLKFAMAAVMISSLFESVQRPGAVKNLTLTNFNNGKKIDNTYVISIIDHKTGVNGVAHLTLPINIYDRLKVYLDIIRPIIDKENLQNVFLMPNGKKVVKLANITRFMESELKVNIPSATEVRKIGATAVAKSCTDQEARLVCKQMSHDPRVAAQYYEAMRGASDAKQAHDTISKIFGTSASSSKILWTTENTKIVEEKFKNYIEKEKPPPLSQCKNIFKDITPKQVVDKVRTLIRQKKRKTAAS